MRRREISPWMVCSYSFNLPRLVRGRVAHSVPSGHGREGVTYSWVAACCSGSPGSKTNAMVLGCYPAEARGIPVLRDKCSVPFIPERDFYLRSIEGGREKFSFEKH